MGVRLATFNVRHGLRPDGMVDTAMLARAVASLDADVVALQEVDRGQARSDGADQARVAGEAMGAVAGRFVAGVAGTMEPRREPGAANPLEPVAKAKGGARVGAALGALRSPGGRKAAVAYLGTWGSRRRATGREVARVPAYGIALLSRYPVRAWRQYRLPLGSPWLLGRLQLGGDEPRVALAAVIETPDGPLTVVTTHLSAWKQQNRVQLRHLVELLADAPRPLVLLGDLNIRADEPAAITGWRDLVGVETFPRHRPWLRLDHVLVDGARGADDGAARALDLGISDHLAVVVDLGSG